MPNKNKAGNKGSADNKSEVGKTVEPCPLKDDASESEVKESTTIRISLYFDGTANNRTNVDHRLNQTAHYQAVVKKKFGTTESYGNDHSNISKLESMAIKESAAEHNISLYVEGIGTTNDDTDTLFGLSLGKGGTGVIAKVEKGLKEVIKKVKALGIDKTKTIDYVHLDTFGFSRGAAAARYCVHVALNEAEFQLKQNIEKFGYTVNETKVKFVGLYDTVASFGLPITHSSDTKDLKLDGIREAETVVHLAAAEEHRKNFRLTNIKSCRTGIELFLPGVHSDIGGGYNDYANEIDRQILDLDVLWSGDKTKQRFIDEKQWLLDRGWYQENSSKDRDPGDKKTTSDIQNVNFWNELKVNKYNIRNTYARIPLHYMAEYATDAGLSFKQSKLKANFAIPKDLRDAKVMLDNYISTSGNKGSSWQDWFDNTSELMKKLRHDYCHFSGYFGSPFGANAPQFNKNKKRERVIQDG